MKIRWRICALLFFATTINYVDRNVLSLSTIDAVIRKEMLGVTQDHELTDADVVQFKADMGFIDMMFKIAYGLGFLFIGYMNDNLGTRQGFSISITIWSLAAVLSGLMGTL